MMNSQKMTWEEAVEYIEKSVKYLRTENEELRRKYEDSLKKHMRLFNEKCVPKKLRVEVDNRHGVLNLFYFCPNCNSFRMKSHRYCSNCGQALNWGETYREFGLKEAEQALRKEDEGK